MQLWTRDIYRQVAMAWSCEGEGPDTRLDAAARKEVAFWLKSLRHRNGKSIVARAAMTEWRVDTSETAVGAHEVGSKRRLTSPLPCDLIGTSSTMRELYGVLTVLKAWGEARRGKVVRLCLDSFAATRNLEKGTGARAV